MVEIQIHPSDIRKKVRYFFLDGSRLRWAAAVVASLVALELFAVAVAPVVALRSREARLASASRAQLSENRKTLEQRAGQLAALRNRAEGDRLTLVKLSQMYGMSSSSMGIGGFPIVRTGPPPAPGSIEEADLILREAEQGVAVASKFLEELLAYESAHQSLVRVTPSVSPIPPDGFVLTSSFGPRTSPFTKSHEFHNGLDMSIPEGTPVGAPSDGTVAFAGRFSLSTSVNWWRYGNCVILNHDGYFQTIFAHLSEVSVRTGQKVRQGAVLGKVGSTGWSTSPHLHYEIRVRDSDAAAGYVPVDPRIYILNCRWNDEAKILAAKRVTPAADEFDPIPIATSMTPAPRGGRRSHAERPPPRG